MLRRMLMLPVLALALIGCSSNTKLVNSWAAPAGTSTTSKDEKLIMVFALAKEEQNRMAMEDTMVKELQNSGFAAITSYSKLGKDYDPRNKEPEDVKLEVGQHANHALILALIEQQNNVEYVEGETIYVPRVSHSGRFAQVYGGMYDVVHEPGYYNKETTYEVISNLYQLAPEPLVWSATTDTVNPESMREAVEGIAHTVAKQLQNDLH